MSALRVYNFNMGFKINGMNVPDPSKFTGAHSSLDASGERDMSGTLHRAMVAMKKPIKIAWNTMEWDWIQQIMQAVEGESFSFTYPDPVYGSTTITAYAGDREWTLELIATTGTYVGNLSFSVIEF